MIKTFQIKKIDLFHWTDGATIVHVLDALRGNAKNWFLNQVILFDYARK